MTRQRKISFRVAYGYLASSLPSLNLPLILYSPSQSLSRAHTQPQILLQSYFIPFNSPSNSLLCVMRSFLNHQCGTHSPFLSSDINQKQLCQPCRLEGRAVPSVSACTPRDSLPPLECGFLLHSLPFSLFSLKTRFCSVHLTKASGQKQYVSDLRCPYFWPS